MSIQQFFVKDSLRKAEIDEFLAKELSRAGYTKVEITKTTLGTRLVVYAAKPGMVIGRRGQSIRDLTTLLEQKFKIENPQISVATIEFPELEPKVVAGQIASALERGIHFRRAAYWALQRVMAAGALGVEISIKGKLSTERGRCEMFRQGYLPKSGEPVLRQVLKGVEWVRLKKGAFGVQVKILPPSAVFPDKPSVKLESEVKPVEIAEAVEEPQQEEAADEDVAEESDVEVKEGSVKGPETNEVKTDSNTQKA